jgi:hypothetical protein
MGDVKITEIQTSAVQEFLVGKGVVTSYWHQKFGVLNRFYRFLMIRNIVDSSPLPTTVPKCPEPMQPYIQISVNWINSTKNNRKFSGCFLSFL